MQVGKRGDLSHMRDAARVEHGRADIVDQPVLDQMLAVPDRAANLPDRKRRRRMLADQAERLLIFRRGRLFDPEGTIRLEILAEPRSEEHTSELQSLMRTSYA